jgi:uncharacterized membrane protein
MMGNLIYGILEKFGYGHPLHPVLVHLVIGPIIAGFVLALVAWIFRKPALFRTARHLSVFAFVCWFFTAGMGIVDWTYIYKSAGMMEITAKAILTAILFIFLLGTIILQRMLKDDSKIPIIFYGLAVVCVILLGFFGGNIVYGKNAAAANNESALTADGFKKVETHGYTFQWKVNGTNLDVKLSYATTGWIGVGFSQDGTMQGSDIKIGYVKDGKAVILDSFGNGQYNHQAKEKLGGRSTVSNVSGSETDGVTTISFTRPLNSGDKNDVVLIPGETYMIILAHGNDGAKDFESYHDAGHVRVKIKL